MTDNPLTKKSLGQHWLRDDASLRAMCDAAEITQDDVVLEIGPGLGTLTGLLLARAKQVIVVEVDEKLARNLTKKLLEHKNKYLEDNPLNRGENVKAGNLRVVNQDILSFDLTQLPAGYKIAANIPYYLTSNLIRNLSESSNPPAVAALLVQKEVAERAAAKPGAMSVLAVTAQFYWEVSLGEIVKAELFEPPPKVDSQILILKRRAEPLFSNVDTKEFFRIVKAGFSQRRKTLSNSLSAGLQLSKLEVEKVLTESKIPLTTRAQTLSLEQWHLLYNALY